MIKFSFIFLLTIISFTQASCQSNQKLEVLTDIPDKLKEASGIAIYDQNAVWTVEDSGNKNKIYKLTTKGTILKNFEVKDVKNHDWEELATDHKGNLYIGDFGNNYNKRDNLAIYKLPNPEEEKGDKIDAEKIKFNFPEQKQFPPEKSALYFDTEAFFHWDGFLYLITKNRTRPYDGKALVYKVPDKKGNYEASLVGEWVICNNKYMCSATSADISEDGKTIAVLTYGLLFIITDFEFDDFSKGTIREIDLGIQTQLESVSFLNKNTLLLVDERTPKHGGHLYKFTLPE